MPKSSLNIIDSKEWVCVVFTTKDNPSMLLRPFNGHVFVIIKHNGAYIKVEYCYGQTFVWSLTHTEIIEIIQEPTITGVFYLPTPHNIKPKFSFRLFTCVELTKQILGIQKWYILTPNQLKRYILKRL